MHRRAAAHRGRIRDHAGNRIWVHIGNRIGARLPACRSHACRRVGRLAGSAASVALVTAAIAVLRPYVPVLSLGVLYIFAVLVAAVLWGIAYALPVAVASMLAFDWYYLSLGHRISLAQAHNWLTLTVYAATAVVVSGLAARARQRADISEQARDRLEGEQAALRRVAIRVARGVPPAEVFLAVAREVAQLLDADVCHLVRHESDHTVTVVACSKLDGCGSVPAGERWTLEGRNIPGLVLQTGRPARADDYADRSGCISESMRQLGVRSSVGTPIVVDGRQWGVVIASSARPEPLPDRTAARLAEFAELAATAISNSDAREELEASRARIVTSADAARRRIERDLHDGTQQRLVSLSLALRAAEASVPRDMAQLRAELAGVVAGMVEALDDLREISQGIHPAILVEGGLGPGLRALARRSAIPVELSGDVETRLPGEIEVAAYYVVSEALTNAAKHAGASLARVALAVDRSTVRVCVRDDGAGGADPSRGSGLIGLADRVQALGGRVAVVSPPGRGTTITAELPLAHRGGRSGSTPGSAPSDGPQAPLQAPDQPASR